MSHDRKFYNLNTSPHITVITRMIELEGTRGPFAGGNMRPSREAEHSPPSSTEVVNE
jgi:hypothetical protein